MNNIHILLAEVVASLWKLAAEENEPLLLGLGVIDRTLEKFQTNLPEPLNTELAFSATSVGLRCLDWPEAELYLQESMLAEIDGSTFTKMRIRMDDDDAVQFLLSVGLSSSQRFSLAAIFYGLVKAEMTMLEENGG